MENSSDGSKYLEQTLECSNCGGIDKIVIEEQVVATGDKVYPSGSVLCAKCKTPTMIKVYRWTKWKKSV
jgi:hypothetical protein